ncbi:MAG TPA: potassium channel family protein [Acidobacteriaceae bacterium]|nr:potassium channel family protein [Acidobacteriaceae bacterium]
MKRTLRAVLETYRSELLLVAFIAAMLSSPLIDHHRRIGGVVAFVQLLLLLVGALHLADLKIVRRVVLPVGLLWLFARLVEAFGDPIHAYTHLAPLAGLALSLAILWGLLRRFGSISKVTSSIISEAIISYLVIAVAFSQLYWLLDHFVTNAFNQSIALGQSGTFLYFSMITLSGVGYGGILPINSYVRLVAAFENITGLFYLAVVISRLVSSYRPRPHPTELHAEQGAEPLE